MELNDILRASFVKRWIIVPTTKDQSLADHTFGVVMIARALAKKVGIDDNEIIKAAIVHDLDEIFTGDLPSTVKKQAREAGLDLNQLYYKVTKRVLTELEREIVGLADKMEAIWFIYNFKTGQIGNQVERVLVGDFYDRVAYLRALDIAQLRDLANAAADIMEEICSTEYKM